MECPFPLPAPSDADTKRSSTPLRLLDMLASIRPILA